MHGVWQKPDSWESAGLTLRAACLFGEAMSRALATTRSALPLSLIHIWPRIEAALTKYLVSSIREKTALAFARHGNDAGMRGAYYHFKERQG